ncbi:MAG: YkgJ family cysteine cluster protein [Planctomycetes bacterium]|nr:YkgJ family cysteine cluster protein [Planctomycetota bacterium]
MNPKKTLYDEGLRFTCERCGNCCKGAPGYVWLTDANIEEISRFIGMDRAEFVAKMTFEVDGRISIAEKDNYECVFYSDEGGCAIYPVRPVQCATYPFWSSIVSQRKEWLAVLKECKGAGKGELHSKEEIEALAMKFP